MRTYNPLDIDEFQTCMGIICEVADTHKFAPYTEAEIKALSGQRIAEVKLPVKLPYTAPCITRRAKYHGLV